MLEALLQGSRNVAKIMHFRLFLDNHWLESLAVFCVCNVILYNNRKKASETWQVPNKVSQKNSQVTPFTFWEQCEKYVFSLATFHFSVPRCSGSF